jgi:hypothetical protein
MALGSAIACFLVMPIPWEELLNKTEGYLFLWQGTTLVFDGATLVMKWSYGAFAAIAAAFTWLLAATASLVPCGSVIRYQCCGVMCRRERQAARL